MTTTSLEALKNESNGEDESSAPSKDSGRFLAGLLLVGLLAFHVVMNLWWLDADNHTIRTDEEGHMLLARTYYDTLFVKAYDGPIDRAIAISQIRPGNPAHPPLFHVAGAVMIALFGYSTDTIALTSTVFFVLLLLGCYRLARSFLDPWQSLFAVFVVSLTPMVFASSRYFMTDFASAAVVVWSVYALIRSEGFHRSGWVFLFGLLNGLGILFRTITFAYLLVPALLAALIGLVIIVRERGSLDLSRPTFGGWLVNLLMALTVSIGIFAPWYYTNLEPFYDYWANKEIGNSRGPLTQFAPPPTPVAPPASPTDPAATPTIIPPTAPAVDPVSYGLEKVKHPEVAWIRYPVYVNNNGLFIVLSALALLGMVTAWLRRQFRSSTILYLYAWIFGSWFFFTVLLRSGTPRYALPVASALALFAAFFVLVLPGRWIRFAGAAVLGVVLSAQYANMTVTSFATPEAPHVAVPELEAESRHFVDDGLVIYKDHVTLGFSYSHLGVPQTDNYKERFVEAMLAHEKTLPVREGQYANYQKLGLRGMPLYEQHYWPGENPYCLKSLTDTDMPERRLRLIHMGLEPAHLLAQLPETDYILYQVDAAHAARVAEYEAYFAAHGFEAIAQFEVPSFGWVPRTINGVLAKSLSGELVNVNTTTIAEMNLYDLHELSESADFVRLPAALQEQVKTAFGSKLAAIANPFALSPGVTFMAAEVTRLADGMFQFRLVFHVEAAMDRDWRMLFHGFVKEEDVARLPEDKQAQGYMDWNFAPNPPTSTWEPGKYVVLTHSIEAAPMVYQIKFGLFQESTLFGQTALLKPMDLAAIPAEPVAADGNAP